MEARTKTGPKLIQNRYEIGMESVRFVVGLSGGQKEPKSLPKLYQFLPFFKMSKNAPTERATTCNPEGTRGVDAPRSRTVCTGATIAWRWRLFACEGGALGTGTPCLDQAAERKQTGRGEFISAPIAPDSP